MSDSIIQAVLSLMWSACAAGLAFYCASVARQITYVTMADGRRQERSLPILFRVLLPLAGNFKPLFSKPMFDRARTNAKQNLMSAGYDTLLTDIEFLALRILVPLFVGPFWVLFVLFSASAVPGSILESLRGVLCLMGVMWLYMYPAMWLRKTVATRHKSIRRSLPFALDLLTLSVEAGMDFMMALQHNVERSKIDELGEELMTVIREIQLGHTRREALLNMSSRVNLSDVRSVISALVQADELGVSIGSILRIQADQMRQRRFERAEKLANEAPVKMLFPLMFFIFPSVFIILLTPIITRLLAQGF